MKRIRELLVDLYECEGDLNDVRHLARILKAAAQEMESKIVKTVTHQYSPTGTTVILLLAETHIAVHTWPEHRYAALDIFICSKDVDPKKGWLTVKNALKPARFEVHEINRAL